MEEGAWEVALKGQRFCEPCCSVWRAQVCAAFSGAGGQAQAIRPEMDHLSARCLGEGLHSCFHRRSQPRDPHMPSHGLRWSRNQTCQPPGPGFRPSPAQQGLACVWPPCTWTQRSQRPAQALLGLWSREVVPEGSRGSASRRAPTLHHEATSVR